MIEKSTPNFTEVLDDHGFGGRYKLVPDPEDSKKETVYLLIQTQTHRSEITFLHDKENQTLDGSSVTF